MTEREQTELVLTCAECEAEAPQGAVAGAIDAYVPESERRTSRPTPSGFGTAGRGGHATRRASVGLVAPCRLVAGDAPVENDVVASAGDRDRVVLDGAETAEEVEHRVGPAPQRTGGRQQVARDENTARVLGRDLHLRDATVRKEAAL
jgi:hypothetical protein